jgi:5-methylcytosine-specific restriction endonuclease McrA
MGRFPQPCIDCGRLSRNGSRCQVHGAAVAQYAEYKRRERKKATGQYSGDYRKRAKAVRETATVCWLCGEGARDNDPWQADHVVPGDPYSVLAPAHRSCNAARGNRL